VVFGVSNPIDGCKLILAQIQIITSSTSSSIVPAPNINTNTNNINDDRDVEIKIVSMIDIVTSPIPFGVNVTEGIFTAGLEFPAIIESNNNIDEIDKNGNDAHIAYWDVVNRQLVMMLLLCQIQPTQVILVHLLKYYDNHNKNNKKEVMACYG
jgi:hypothetical protein